MPEIHVPSGQVVLISDEDQDLLQYRWCLNAQGYPMRYVGGGRKHQQKVLLSWVVLERHGGPRPVGHYADHRNRNPLDNRRENLRWLTPTQSNWNRRTRPNPTGYLGVHRPKRYPHKYTASIQGHGRLQYLGIYNDPVAAAKAYDAAARVICGSLARLNFPEDVRA